MSACEVAPAAADCPRAGFGLPGFQFIQDPLDYFPFLHHTNQDVYDHAVPEDLIQSAVVMAYFVYQTAMREEMLPRKTLPIPVEMPAKVK